MSGVAIEDLLELWSAELRKAKAKLGWLIGHPSVVASAAAFLDTLLGPERRKTGWMRAEAAGDVGREHQEPWGSVLHGWAGWRRGRPVSMLRIPPSCRTNTMPTAATTFRGRSDA